MNIIEEARLGGPQIRIASVAAELRKRGVETIVYSAEINSEKFQELLASQETTLRKFRLTRLQNGLFKQIRYILDTPFTLLRFYKALREDSPAVLHVNSSAQWRGALAGVLAGIPVVWHLNDTNMPSVITKLFSKVFFRLASGFIVAGKRVHTYYLDGREGDRPVSIIPAPVKVDRFNPTTTEKSDDISSVEGIRVVSVGHVNPDKDTKTFVKMAGLLKEVSGKSIEVFQIGGKHEGQKTYCDAVDALAAELGVKNISFLGERPDIPELLAASDIYVCSSRSEASPTSVWEALAAGLPIVSTDVGDVAEYSSTHHFAKLAPVGDEKALADAVLETIEENTFNKPDERQRRHEIAKELFSLDQVVKKHLEIYQRIA